MWFYIFTKRISKTKLRQPTGQSFFLTYRKEFSHFLQTIGSHSWVILENAKKNLVFHFGGGRPRHASFPQKPVFKKLFHPIAHRTAFDRHRIVPKVLPLAPRWESFCASLIVQSSPSSDSSITNKSGQNLGICKSLKSSLLTVKFRPCC